MFFPGNRTASAATMRLRALVAVVFAVMAALAVATPASAHTALDSTNPDDGATVTEAVDEVALTFTLPVTPLGDAVVITGPDGVIESEVTQEREGEIVVATPAEPLEDGDYSVEWTVAAQDGHPLDGTFRFTVEGVTPSESPSPSASPSVSESGVAGPSASPSPSPTASMEAMDAESGSSESLAAVVARAGAAIALWALLVGAGALAFAGLAMRDEEPRDVSRVLAGVRWCGALLLGGLALRLVGRSALIAGGSFTDGLRWDALGDALAGTVLWVFALQAFGGLFMLLGAWRSVGASWLAIVGVLVAGAGHVLGGHSNTAEPRWLVLSADIAHLLAAAVWVGGVVALVAMLRRRRRAGLPSHAAGMASRFGVIAAGAFVVVGLAGVALTWAIIDEISDLWTTAWGLTLLAKVALVLVVAAIGAYTHFSVVPRLAARAESAAQQASDPSALASESIAGDKGLHLSRAAAWESAIFGLVVIATAILVAASIHV